MLYKQVIKHIQTLNSLKSYKIVSHLSLTHTHHLHAHTCMHARTLTLMLMQSHIHPDAHIQIHLLISTNNQT